MIRWAAWVFFGLTVISTLYFGWHYVADDIGGVVIAVLAVWLGGIATGQKFERYGLRSQTEHELGRGARGRGRRRTSESDRVRSGSTTL